MSPNDGTGVAAAWTHSLYAVTVYNGDIQLSPIILTFKLSSSTPHAIVHKDSERGTKLDK